MFIKIPFIIKKSPTPLITEPALPGPNHGLYVPYGRRMHRESKLTMDRSDQSMWREAVTALFSTWQRSNVTKWRLLWSKGFVLMYRINPLWDLKGPQKSPTFEMRKQAQRGYVICPALYKPLQSIGWSEFKSKLDHWLVILLPWTSFPHWQNTSFAPWGWAFKDIPWSVAEVSKHFLSSTDSGYFRPCRLSGLWCN